MILDVKRNRLIKNIELTPQETDILKSLCTGDLIDYEEILKYTKISSIEALRSSITRLKDKTGLNIETRKNMGLILRDILFIDY